MKVITEDGILELDDPSSLDVQLDFSGRWTVILSGPDADIELLRSEIKKLIKVLRKADATFGKRARTMLRARHELS